MARDVEAVGALRRSTAVWMWTAYGVHAAATACALVRSDRLLRIPSPMARSLGVLGVVGGASLTVAGMGRFSGPAQVEGTRAQALTTSGIYRWSRNPQYLGYLLTLTSVAIGRRSLTAMALTVAAGVLYAKWIPVEERQLTAAHGEAYERYRARTHRWWGISPRRRGLPMPDAGRSRRASGPCAAGR